MNYHLIAVSHLKLGPEKDLFDQYNKRLTRSIKTTEIKQLNAPEKEAQEILKHIQPNDWVCVLDERGKDLTSRELSLALDSAHTTSKKQIFIIGGADGLSDALRSRANLMIRFGKTTWPHLLVRSMLIEQLYRCQQILSNHPYHRD